MEFMIVTFILLMGVLMAIPYVILYRRLLNILKKEYPEKWKELDEPEFLDDSGVRETGRFLRFLWRPQGIVDPDHLKMIRRIRTGVIVEMVLIGGPILYFVIKFVLSTLILTVS